VLNSTINPSLMIIQLDLQYTNSKESYILRAAIKGAKNGLYTHRITIPPSVVRIIQSISYLSASFQIPFSNWYGKCRFHGIPKTGSREKVTLHVPFSGKCFLANMDYPVSSLVNRTAAKTWSVVIRLSLRMVDYRSLGCLLENSTSSQSYHPACRASS
jgi:hypothetical protein